MKGGDHLSAYYTPRSETGHCHSMVPLILCKGLCKGGNISSIWTDGKEAGGRGITSPTVTSQCTAELEMEPRHPEGACQCLGKREVWGEGPTMAKWIGRGSEVGFASIAQFLQMGHA